MAKLISIGGIRHGQAYVLKGGVNRIGSAAGNDLLIRNPTIAPFHCELSWKASALHVRDLGSERGTFVEGVAVREAGLCDGQVLRVGEVEMKLQAEPGETFAVLEMELGVNALEAEEFASELESEPTMEVASAPVEPAAAPRVCLDGEGRPVRVSSIRVSQKGETAAERDRAETGGKLTFQNRTMDGPTLESMLWSSESPAPSPPASTLPRRRPAPPLNFFAEIPRAFAYPFRSDGVTIILAGSLFFAGINWMGGFFFLLGIMVAGYIFTAMKGIINATAVGEEKAPDWPEYSSWWDDLLLPFVEFAAIHVACFLPALVALSFISFPTNCIVGGVLLVLGFALAPMALLAVAIFDSVMALNPILIVASICRVPLEYLVACLTLVASYVLGWALNMWLMAVIPYPVLPWMLTSVVSLYLLVVEMRILGLLYRCKQKELGWIGKYRR